MPFELLSNRSALSGYIATFLHAIIVVAQVFYLPVFFQAVLGTGPTVSRCQIMLKLRSRWSSDDAGVHSGFRHQPLPDGLYNRPRSHRLRSRHHHLADVPCSQLCRLCVIAALRFCRSS